MILKIAKRCFQDTKNVFNNIVVNKLKTVDSTYLSKLFYLLNLGVYLYYKKNSHTSNLKLITTAQPWCDVHSTSISACGV